MLLTKTNDKESKRTITEIKRTIRKLDYLKTKASRESKLSRSADARRKIQMGGLIITAGLDHLFDGKQNPHYKNSAAGEKAMHNQQTPLPTNILPSPNLLLGLLLDAKETLDTNTNTAEKWQQKGKAFWNKQKED